MDQEKMDKRIIPGTKFFKYYEEKEEPEIIRIYKVSEGDKSIGYYDSENHKHDMKYNKLTEEYKMLRPDGVILFSIVELSPEINDVIVSLQSYSLEDKYNKALPFAICRQSVYDFFSNMATAATDPNRFTVGISVNQDSCPADINFADLLTCGKLVSNVSISIYLDDTLDDILRFVKAKKYNEVLRTLKQVSLARNPEVMGGYTESLRELLSTNNFMYDFRKCFNIMEIPFTVDEDSEELSVENIHYMENELKVNIMETYLIRYTKEIDLRTIKRDFKLVSSSADKYNKVYIVGYDKADGDYIPRQ